MYKQIRQQLQLVDIYKKQLVQDKILSEEKAGQIVENAKSLWEEQLNDLRSSKTVFSKKDYMGQKSENKKKPLQNTKISPQNLEEMLSLISNEPKDIQIHPKIKKILERRRQALARDRLDWTVCELTAYGSLVKEGFSVRLTGQDSKRGTFSHRHAIYYDYKQKGLSFSPLKQLARNHNKEFCLYNSPLSEMAVLAFEYGNSCLAPDFLTLWEAQFGGFCQWGANHY